MNTIKCNNIFFAIKSVDYLIRIGLAIVLGILFLNEFTDSDSLISACLVISLALVIGLIFSSPFIIINLVGLIWGVKGVKDTEPEGIKKLKTASILGIISAALDIVFGLVMFVSAVRTMVGIISIMKGTVGMLGIIYALDIWYLFILIVLNVGMLIVSIMNTRKLSKIQN